MFTMSSYGPVAEALAERILLHVMELSRAFIGGLLSLTLLALPAVVLADVKAGVDAWSAGDYERAVREWRDPAAEGDPDAQFNLAQAYRLGRGVERNAKQAELYYAKAAAQGHLKAADNLGLMLFQTGQRQEAVPYVQAGAGRGDPRAQYLLGIAHFNGDLVEKDWVRAYALLTLANAAGLPQAAPAIQQMDDYIPLEQRQEAQPLAAQLKSEADARRSSQLAAADLGSGNSVLAEGVPRLPRERSSDAAPLPAAVARLPQPLPETSVAPSVVAARAALAEAARVTGTQSPADAGVSFAVAASTRPEPQTAASPPPATVGGGQWKVQLGAFSIRANADKLWARLADTPELAGAGKLLEPAGRLTRLLAAGFASEASAQAACTALKRSGQDCLVTR